MEMTLMSSCTRGGGARAQALRQGQVSALLRGDPECTVTVQSKLARRAAPPPPPPPPESRFGILFGPESGPVLAARMTDWFKRLVFESHPSRSCVCGPDS